MPNTITYSFGEVLLVPFPFTDQTTNKKRPAVVVSSAGYKHARPDPILMPITGQLSGYPRLGEVAVTDWKVAALIKPSTIKPILTTIQKTLVLRILGQLSERDVLSLKEALKIIIG